MINDHEVLHLVIEAYPKSRSCLVAEVEDWLPEKGPIIPHGVLNSISHLVKDKFLVGEYDHAEELFDLIERFIDEGSQSVAEAACTCFIENLQNICGSDGFEPSHFASLLGPKSKEYAKAWDEFTGAKTKGI